MAGQSTGSTIRAGELEVGYIDAGSGVPLLLVHGGRSDRTQFAPLRAHLGAGIRVISYDQRDSGITVNPPVPYTMGDLGDDLVDLLEMSHADIQKAVADFFLTPEGQAKLPTPTAAARALTPRDAEQSARRNDAARKHEVRDRLGEIAAPTLIVHGTADRLAPYSGALLMEQRIPDAELRSIEGGRHAIALEFPDTIARWVREFLGVTAA